MGRGESTGCRGIPRRVKGRLVNDGVEAHVGMLDPEIVSTEPILLPDDNRVRDNQCVLPPVETKETSPVAQRPPTIEFEDVLLDEARRMSRSPRMDTELYHALKQNIGSGSV